MTYRDRIDAGHRLADAIASQVAFTEDEVPLVLGIPRGGVPVAAVVAARLGADLDVLVAHKLGAPGNPEFAVGAVAEDGTLVVDDAAVTALHIPRRYLEQEAERQLGEVRERAGRLRGGAEPAVVAGRTVVVVDDGIATGATFEAALRLLQAAGARRVIAAAPVASPESVRRLTAHAETVVCPLVPRGFRAVGTWYQVFDQVSDSEVVAALAGGR